MTAKDVLLRSMDMSAMVVEGYLADLDDDALLVRALPGMNHIAWQVGHLIGSERHFIEMVRPGSSPPLPDDFDEGHGRQATGLDDPSKYYSKAKYLELWKAQRAASKAVLDATADADLDRTDEKFPPFANTVGALFELCGGHWMMHAGQFVAVRRKLGKPVTM